MGLSEPRKKQRLVGAASQANTAWLNDTSLPGQRMMSMMGWAPGSGLGTTNKGRTSNIAVAMKLDNKGIGAQRHEREALEQGKADAWVGAGGDLGSLFDRLNQANDTVPSPAETTNTAALAAVVAEPRPAFSRLAHRSKFRRAKQMVGTSEMGLNEILGIKGASGAPSSGNSVPAASSTSSESSESSEDESPSPKAKKKADKSKRSRKGKAEDMSEKPKKAKSKKDKSKKSSSTKDKSNKEKKDKSKKTKASANEADAEPATDTDARRAKADKKKHKARTSTENVPSKRKREDDVTVVEEESANVVMNTSGQFVFQYLSNKLMLKKAELARRRREQGQWWSA